LLSVTLFASAINFIRLSEYIKFGVIAGWGEA